MRWPPVICSSAQNSNFALPAIRGHLKSPSNATSPRRRRSQLCVESLDDTRSMLPPKHFPFIRSASHCQPTLWPSQTHFSSDSPICRSLLLKHFASAKLVARPSLNRLCSWLFEGGNMLLKKAVRPVNRESMVTSQLDRQVNHRVTRSIHAASISHPHSRCLVA